MKCMCHQQSSCFVCGSCLLFNFCLDFSGYSSPALVIRSTPPEQQQNRRARKRIRLDKSLVLPNK